MYSHIEKQKSSILITLLSILSLGCMEAKRISIDTNTPSGLVFFAALSFLSQTTNTVPDTNTDHPNQQYSIRFSVTGLNSGNSMTLTVNGSNPIQISGNGNFIFPEKLSNSTSYKVAVSKRPAAQSCSIENRIGSVNGADISNINVVCHNSGSYLPAAVNPFTGQAGHQFVKSMSVQSDGKVVVAGDCATNQCITRFTNDGILDISFAENGWKLINSYPFVNGCNACSSAYTGAVNVDPRDDQIILAGGGSGKCNTFARFSKDGTADSSFGVNGFTQNKPATGSNNLVNDLFIESDGSIYAAGIHSPVVSSYQFSAVKIDISGNVDTSFANSGFYTGAIDTYGYSVAKQSNGRIIYGGGTTVDTILYRFIGNGLDSSFGTSGAVTAPGQHNAKSLAVYPDNKILALTSSADTYYNCQLFRYNADGKSLDSTFSGDGVYSDAEFRAILGLALIDPYYCSNVTLQEDGKILLAITKVINNLHVLRLNSDGTLDTDFAGDGVLDLNLSAACKTTGYSLSASQNLRIVTDGNSGIFIGYSCHNIDTSFNRKEFTVIKLWE